MPKTKYEIAVEFEDDFSGRSTSRVGVGEHVGVALEEKPAPKVPTEVTWKVTKGDGDVEVDRKGRATLVVGRKSGALQVAAFDGKEELASKRFEVVAPDGAFFANPRGVNESDDDWASFGFEGEIVLTPADVSFKWVEFREGEAPYEGTGIFAKAEVSLEELKGGGIVHPVITGGVVGKNKTKRAQWIACTGGSAKGTTTTGVDTVKCFIPKAYGEGGSFEWNIPWFFRVGGKGEERFMVASHVEKVTSSGKATMSKLGTTASMQL